MTAAIKMDVEALAGFFRALGDPTRLRIVALLCHGELCVCHVEGALLLAQPTASRQLGLLFHAGIVSRRRAGAWTVYSLAKQASAERGRLLSALVTGFADQKALKRDVARLLKVRGPQDCTTQTLGRAQ